MASVEAFNFEYHYTYALDRKPGVTLPEERIERDCPRCGAHFVTGCRRKRRCDACQALVMDQRRPRWQQRTEERRKAAREGRAR